MNAVRRLRGIARVLCCRHADDELLITLATFVICFVLFAR